MKIRLPGFALWVIMLCSCHPHPPSPSQGNKQAGVFRYPDARAFIESLVGKEGIVMDTSWKAHINIDSFQEAYERILDVTKLNQDTAVTIGFRINNISISTDGNNVYINGNIIAPDSGVGTGIFYFNTLRKFSFYGRGYIILSGGMYLPVGIGGRVHYNYCINISARSPQVSVFTSYEMLLEPPFIYGNINNDSILDRVAYDGVLYPGSVNRVELKAQTYTPKGWQDLKDKSGKPYRIILRTDADMDTFDIDSVYWPKKFRVM